MMNRISKTAEGRLRDKIRQMLSEAGVELAPTQQEYLEEQFIELFHEYSLAPEDSKDEVYATGEDKILRDLPRAS